MHSIFMTLKFFLKDTTLRRFLTVSKSKENIFKERLGFCSQFLGGNLSALGMSCLRKVSLFACERWPHQIVHANNEFMVRALGHMVSSSVSAGAGRSGQPLRLSTIALWPSPDKNSGHQGSGELGWLAMPHVYCHELVFGRNEDCPNTTWRGQLE